MVFGDAITSVIIIGGVTLLLAIGSAVWEVITEEVEQVEQQTGVNFVSYTCEHCEHTIVHWNQDPMVTDVYRCPACGSVLQDQGAAHLIAQEYYDDLENVG